MRVLQPRRAIEIGPQTVNLAVHPAVWPNLGFCAVDLIEIGRAAFRYEVIIDVEKQDLCFFRLGPFPGLLDG